MDQVVRPADTVETPGHISKTTTPIFWGYQGNESNPLENYIAWQVGHLKSILIDFKTPVDIVLLATIYQGRYFPCVLWICFCMKLYINRRLFQFILANWFICCQGCNESSQLDSSQPWDQYTKLYWCHGVAAQMSDRLAHAYLVTGQASRSRLYWPSARHRHQSLDTNKPSCLANLISSQFVNMGVLMSCNVENYESVLFGINQSWHQ